MSPDDLLTLARLSEETERYEDMCGYTQELVKSRIAKGEEVSTEERNLFSVAYKNVVGSKRASLRTLDHENDKEEVGDIFTTFQGLIETELKAKCEEVLEILEKHLLPSVKGRNDESEVFYLKMSGDYLRYLAEFNAKNEEEYPKKSQIKYEEAMAIAKDKLTETHPTRLGLALNYSVCLYEILQDGDKACELAKDAFDEAIQGLDGIKDTEYKDSTLIMQLIRDNLTLWTKENEERE